MVGTPPQRVKPPDARLRAPGARSRRPGIGYDRPMGTANRPSARGALGARLRAAAAAAVLLLGGAWAALPAPAAAQPAGAGPARLGVQQVDTVAVELVADRVALVPGRSVDLGLRLLHAPHWHTYWRNPGDSGLPTQVDPTGPDGTRFEPIRWPAPKRMWLGPLANYGYEGEVVLPFSVTLPAAFAGATARIEAHAQWLVCKDVCIPGEARVALELPVLAPGADAPARSARAALFDAMASRSPDPARPLLARWHRDGAQVAVVFDLPTGVDALARAEFFPYEPGVVLAPAPQRLARLAQGWRIDLTSADGAVMPDALEGLLVADGRPYELRATAGGGAPEAGTPVSVADQPAGLSRPAGAWLGSLLGSSPAPAAAGSPIAAAAPPDGLSLGLALLFGAIGGLLLNLMPCVFPVVGLKVMGFARSAHGADSRGAMRRGALAFSAGVLVSFWVLGGALLALRAAGEAVGWGFQLQSPGFVMIMALLFVAVGLNFSGVFDLGAGLTRLGAVGGDSTAGAFGAGVLAVLVATPCTAPFMGSALGFTLAQPPALTLGVFSAIGVGMALPYLLLGLFPAWLRLLPRPGRWMETLRQVLAFPMYATAAWLAWVLVQQSGADALLRLLLGAVLVGVAAWAWGRFGAAGARRPAIAWGTLAASIAMTAWLLLPVARFEGESAAALPGGPLAVDGAVAWEPWSEQRVAEAVTQGRPVFIDFTAAWCVSCQANKKLVLERGAVVDEMRRLDVLALRADWTQRDPAITAALARHGRNGVPLYLVYRPGQAAPDVLPELLTVQRVLDALRGV